MKTGYKQNGTFDNTLNQLCLIIFLTIYSFTFGQSTANNQFASPTEKIYLHSDRAYYTSGETIWFKVYLMDGVSHKAEALSEIAYVELINPVNKMVVRRTIKMKNGSAAGDFKLAVGATSGEYTIRAYTNLMRNFDADYFFRKKIYVNSGYASTEKPTVNTVSNSTDFNSKLQTLSSKNANLDVQFFPEGGHMVSGFLNRIAFKAVDIDGKGIDISGRIVDDKGNEVTQFNTEHLGMGALHFIPTADKTYHAIIKKENGELKFALPTIQKKGTLMTLAEGQNHYRIDLRSSSPTGINGLKIIGKQKNGVVLDATIKKRKSSAMAVVRIPKDSLEEGIVQFTLFDVTSNPLAERLLFHSTDVNVPNTAISTSKDSYGQRELVSLEIELDSSAMKDTNADISLAVTDVSVTQPEFQLLDIRTYLLLNSELRGEIEQPGYYFHSNDPKRKKNLDLLMLTQGWRQFLINESIVDSESNFPFLPETGISIKGSLRNPYDGKKTFTADVTLTYSNKEELGHEVVKTNEEGRFIFKDLNLSDTTKITLRSKAYTSKRKSSNGNPNFIIEIDSASFPKETRVEKLKREAGTHMPIYLTKPQNAQSISRSFIMNSETILLDEAVVASKKPKLLDAHTRKRQSAIYLKPSKSLDFDEIRNTSASNPLTALQGRLPGVRVTDNKVYLRGRAITFKNGSEPLYLLDGLPSDNEMIAALPISEIDFIDILTGAETVIYGSRGAYGVVAVYTLDGRERFDANKISSSVGTINFIHHGYDYPRKFYKPIYQIKKPEHEKLDYSTTLHWQPNIEFDENGKAKVSFYTGDMDSTYKVIIEGVASNGVPISSSTFFHVTGNY